MNRKKRLSKGRIRGFSLLESMIALTILAIMLVVASTSFLNLAPKYRLRSAVWEINSRLNYARYKAIFEGTKVRIRFKTSSYIIEKYDDEQKEWKKERVYFINGIAIQANNSPIFHPGGTVSDLASISISNSWGRYRITLAISGRIKTVPF